MRIIAGIAKGRTLRSPQGRRTRPPTERMREAVFSTLGSRVHGRTVLDLYAGTGAWGLEALSRGAASATFVERDRKALAALAANVEAVGLGGRVVGADVGRAMSGERQTFGLVFVDPPYSTSEVALESVLEAVAARLSDGGLVIVHRRHDHPEPGSAGTLRLTDHRRYGDAGVWWYTKEDG